MSCAGRPSRHGPDEERDLLRAVVEQRDGGPECTLYPDGSDGVELMSRWITADEKSFVGLAEME